LVPLSSAIGEDESNVLPINADAAHSELGSMCGYIFGDARQHTTLGVKAEYDAGAHCRFRGGLIARRSCVTFWVSEWLSIILANAE
jgi:hypothetical protein